jgi:hypothetical protein
MSKRWNFTHLPKRGTFASSRAQRAKPLFHLPNTFNRQHPFKYQAISQNIMKFRMTAALIASTSLQLHAKAADVAPEITVLAEGYNLIAKLPCVGCPFVYRDPLSTEYLGWKTREEENALVRRHQHIIFLSRHPPPKMHTQNMFKSY